VTLPDVQAMMGHANIITTMRYVHCKPRIAEVKMTAKVTSSALPSRMRSAGGGTRTPDTRIMIPLL
jgi:hypothetical protein